MTGWRTRSVVAAEVAAPWAGPAPTAIEMIGCAPRAHTTSAGLEASGRASRRKSRSLGIAMILLMMTAGVLAIGLSRRPAVPVISAGGCDWQSPVDGPVVDPFRRPGHRYGPGNRGLEYGAAAGTPVRAVADGVVRFAGPVGGRYYLVIEHDGALRSTYGPMSAVVVVRGQTVEQATGLGLASVGFHLTARLGGRYIDPQPLLDGRCGRARLVPVGRAPSTPTVDPSLRSGSHGPAESAVVPPRVLR